MVEFNKIYLYIFKNYVSFFFVMGHLFFFKENLSAGVLGKMLQTAYCTINKHINDLFYFDILNTVYCELFLGFLHTVF